jgi:pheromone shutdown protein TraB
MVKLKYIGTHQPQGMIIEVDEDRAKELLKSNEFIDGDIKQSVKKAEVKDDSKLGLI